jgi:hypothetical protein
VLILGTCEATMHPKKRNSMLPVLVVLFLISYGLMSLLVVEQGRTIDSQKNLIRDLFNDSVQLNAMKIKEVLRQRAAAQPPAQNNAQAKSPSSQVSPQNGGKNSSAVKTQRPALQKPPKPAADAADARRIPLTV